MFSWLPILDGIAMALSSVTVVANSLLLGRYKPANIKNTNLFLFMCY
jgi:P-type Cu+ transporter